MRSHIKTFSYLVGDVMEHRVFALPAITPLIDVVHQMCERKVGYCIALDEKKRVCGILLHYSLLAHLAEQGADGRLLKDVMSLNTVLTSAREYLYQAIAQMRGLQAPLMIVVDEAKRLKGVIRLEQAINSVAAPVLSHIDRLGGENDIQGLRLVKRAQVELAQDLFDEGVPASDVQHLVSHINNDIYRRVIDRNIQNMANEGWGEPPVGFCVIIMGSGGRRESYLLPDQDNGFILQDYPDEDHNRIDRFFRELSTRMCFDLNEVGFSYCKGNVMASNPLWRKTISQWKQQVNLWGRKRNSIAVRLADIFFDFQPVWGMRTLARELRSNVLKTVKNNHFFLQEMFRETTEHQVALGLFRRVATQTEGRYRGHVDLKYNGILPLIESVRLLSLKNKIRETSTLERLNALYNENVLSAHEQETLSRSFRTLTEILLNQQVLQYLSGEEVSRYVAVKDLPHHTQDQLTEALREIDSFQKRVRGEFTGNIF